MLIRRKRLFWFGAGLFVVGFAFLIFPPYSAYCEGHHANDYYCYAYKLAVTLSALVEAHSGAFTALATIAIAWFTLTLKRSTDKLWLSAERQFGYAQQQESRALLERAEDRGSVREQLKIAEQSADAATINAKAVIDAERAHLYVIIKNETIKSIFEAARQIKEPGGEDGRWVGPGVQYVFKNYGKSPAILQFVLHGLIIDRERPEKRTLDLTEEALEVIGVNKESPLNTAVYTRPFTVGDAKALLLEQAFLFFYGEATYIDAFGGRVKLTWEFLADRGKLRQTKHAEEREHSPEAE